MADPIFGSNLDSLTPSGATVTIATGTLPVTTDRYAQLSFGATVASPIGARTAGGAMAVMLKNATTVVTTWWSLWSSTGVECIRFRMTATTTMAIQYWNGATWVTIGSTFTPNTSVQCRYLVDFSGCGTASGSVTWAIVTDNPEVAVASGSATGLNFSSIPNIGQIRSSFADTNSGLHLFGPHLLQDTTVFAAYAYYNAPNANGTDTDGTGTFASINDTGSTYDSTFIALPASTNRRSVKNSANRNYGGRTVAAVGFPARLRCGATGPTQCKLYLKIGGTRYYHPTTLTLTTSFADYFLVWLLNPATSAAWALTEAQDAAMEYGVEAV